MLVATAVVAGYYLAPLDGVRDGSAVIRLVLVVVLVAVVGAASFRSVQRADHPMLRAGESLALLVPLFIVGFASVYGAISATDAGAFTERLDHTGALYLALATSTTVGFGDIAATSDGARVAAMAQMVSNVVVIGLTARALLAAARNTVQGGAPVVDATGGDGRMQP